tara:strand:- start:1431 stop:2168 length:738 start_codon:yes stop_codon:yes gene_type:complete
MSYFKIYKIDATKSTNDYLKNLYFKKKIHDGFILTTNHQTSGRGQRNNTWESEPGKNLILSIYKDLKDLKIKNPFLMNAIISLALIETLKELKVPELKIKWPNDILSASKKISGILIENFFKTEFITSTIIGIGLNVNQINFKKTPNACSVFSVTGFSIDLDEALKCLIKNIQKKFKYIEKFSSEQIFFEYESFLYKKDESSLFKSKNKIFIGFIKGINEIGRLKILNQDKEIEEYDLKEIELMN